MLTLGTQRDLTNDMLIKGIIDSVVTVNQFYQMLPFKGIQGNALAYNRESLTDQTSLVGFANTADSSIKTDAQTFTRHNTELTTIIGDAQINGLIQAVGSDYNDATAVQIAAKAKGIGRTYMNALIHGSGNIGYTSSTLLVDINGDAVLKAVLDSADYAKVDTLTERKASVNIVVGGKLYTGILTTGATLAAETLTSHGADVMEAAQKALNGFTGFAGLKDSVASGNDFSSSDTAIVLDGTAAKGNEVLSRLDKYIDRVHDKDGMIDYMMMNSEGVRKITQAFRAVGTGFDMMDVKTSSGGVMAIQSYRGVPLFRNDFIGGSSTTTRSGLDGGDGQGTNAGTEIFLGTVDDGSFTHGICGLTAIRSAGIVVESLGPMEDRDSSKTRVKWYCGLANFSELGLVRGNL